MNVNFINIGMGNVTKLWGYYFTMMNIELIGICVGSLIASLWIIGLFLLREKNWYEDLKERDGRPKECYFHEQL